jgi:thiol-disulfide isomerase/thioredoxin
MKNYFISIIAFFVSVVFYANDPVSSCIQNGVAPTITVKARFTALPAMPGNKMVLEYMTGDQWKQIENKPISDNGEVTYVFTPPSYGQYRFRMPGPNNTQWSDFIISDGKKEPLQYEFEIVYTSMKGNPLKIESSPENKLYFELISLYLQYDAKRQDKNVNPEDLLSVQKALNDLARKMAIENKGTFTGDVVADLVYQPMRSDYPKEKWEGLNDSLFYAKFGIAKLPYYESGALCHNLFIRSLERYFKHFHNEKNELADIDFMDGVMLRSGGNEEVDAFLFKYLLDKMLGYKNEIGLSHLLSHYAQDCTESQGSKSQTDLLVKALNEVAPGKKVHSLVLPDIKGTPVSLIDVCKKNEMTLMLFWKSSCNHCEEFKPVLRKLYDQYHSKGLEVYAVSIDKAKEDWEKYVQGHPQPWKDTFLAYDKRKEFNEYFPVPSTPTLIALDREGKVITRLIVRGKIEEYLKDHFESK